MTKKFWYNWQKRANATDVIWLHVKRSDGTPYQGYATRIDGKIQSVVLYDNLYILKIFNDDPYEGQMYPFFSVNPKTGEFKEFSVVSGKVDMKELARLFKAAESK